ncbi:hypothetical protein C8R43DRAFT_942204 [Mycena crocata]|nr:hypothetical protein C8R43DRAFT_942204 [Mycena crocata]
MAKYFNAASMTIFFGRQRCHTSLGTFSIPNPFILDDEQHLDFHRHLEQQNNKFQNGFSMLQVSGSMWKFVFFIPPGHVLHEDICQEFHKAMQRARLPKSQLYILCAISFFDEIGDWSGEGKNLWDVPLCVKNVWDVPNWWDVPLCMKKLWDVPLWLKKMRDVPVWKRKRWNIPNMGEIRLCANCLGHPYAWYGGRFGSEWSYA